MEIDRKKIIETFERIEDEAGGIWNAIPSMTLDKTAKEVGLPREIVRAIMIGHWTMRGAG